MLHLMSLKSFNNTFLFIKISLITFVIVIMEIEEKSKYNKIRQLKKMYSGVCME